MFESAAEGILLSTLNGWLLVANPAAARMLGYDSPEELASRLAESGGSVYVDPDTHRALVEHVARQGGIQGHDVRCRRRDGTELRAAVSARLVGDDASGTSCLLTLITETGERDGGAETRALLAAIVESSNDAIIGRSLDGAITSWNAGAERMLGWRAEEAVGRPLRFTLPPGQRDRGPEFNEKLRRGEAIPPHETRRVRRDGSVIDVMSTVSPVRNAAGSVIGASLILRDITALKQAATQRSQLAAIVEASNDAITSRDLEGRILTWNPAAERLFGWSAAEAIGQDGSIIIPPEARDAMERNRAALHAGHMVPTFETVRMTCDGRRIHVAVTPSAVRDETGAVASVSLVFRDITDRMRAEAAQKQLAAIVEDSNDAIISRDLNGRILTWNPAAERLFGWTTEEAIGQSIDIIIPPDQQADVARGRAALARGEPAPARDTVRRTRSGGRVEVSLSQSMIRDESGRPMGVSLTFRDISERRRAEREAQRRAAMTELLAALAAAANSAVTPVEAMQACLERIFRHGDWSLGRVALFKADEPMPVLAASIWHGGAPRFEAFQRLSETYDYAGVNRPGTFLHTIMHTKRPVWVRDIPAAHSAGRLATAAAGGLLSAFGFPVVVAEHVAALLEFYSEERREPDDLLLENITSIASQLARLIERDRAAGETARLAAIVENANDAIIGRTLDGIITSWNRAAEKLYGYSAAEAIGQSVSMILPPRLQANTARNNEVLLRDGHVPPFETQRLTRDGRIIDVSNSLSPIRDAAGRIVGAAQITRDITELKRVQEELKRKSALTALMEALARTVNEAATVEQALQACLNLICGHGGWRVGHVVTFLPDREGYVPATSLWSISDSDRMLMAKLIVSVEEYDYTRAAGPFVSRMLAERRPSWVEDLKAYPYRGRFAVLRDHGLCSLFGFPVVVGGKAIALLQFFSDWPRAPDTLLIENITNVSAQLARAIEREWARAALSASERRLRAIVDNEPECVKVIGADGRLIEMNRSGLGMLEVDSVRQAREHGVIPFVAPEHRQLFEANFRRVLAGQSVRFQFEIVGARGTRRWLESQATPMELPGTNERVMLAITRDMTAQKQAQERADYLSNFDPVTELPNRTLFLDRLKFAVAHARRRAEHLGLLRLNLDRFGKVNESLGHETGDALLHDVGQRLKALLREVDTIARLGGNEFAILVEGTSSSRDIAGVADKIMAALAEPFVVKGHELFVSASMGVAFASEGEFGVTPLLEAAERAMARAKREGGGEYQLFEEEPIAWSGRQQLTLEMRLHRALENGELAVHYQPKLSLASGEIVGAEALLRWTNPDLGPVAPVQFIPLAEQTGLIIPIGAWVLETACRQAALWRAGGHVLRIAVNLSPRQFRQKDLASVVESALRRAGLDADALELEITESTAMSNAEQTVAVLSSLNGIGVRLAVDDFGTGYSSLSYLKRFPLHSLKIDRSFVRDIGVDPNSEAIVGTTVALAHSLKLTVVAEGVETESQRAVLAALGCEEYQGFLASRPVPASELTALVEGRLAEAPR